MLVYSLQCTPFTINLLNSVLVKVLCKLNILIIYIETNKKNLMYVVRNRERSYANISESIVLH